MARPSFWRRLQAVLQPSAWDGQPPALTDAEKRAAWQEAGVWHHHDAAMNESGLLTPQLRRSMTSNADLVALHGAIYAAVRRRSTDIKKARLRLMQKRRSGDPVEIDSLDHPALAPLHRVNEGLTQGQGRELMEINKCTAGRSVWVARRQGARRAGAIVDFEIWDPLQTRVVPFPDRPWVAKEFRRRRDNGDEDVVGAEDVAYFRHMIDPRNNLNGLSPIGAVRVQAETGLEAGRVNLAFFDNDASPASIWTVEDAGEGEIERIEQRMQTQFRGSGNKWKSIVTSGGLQQVTSMMPHKDMQWAEQQAWGVIEVARVFEMQPTRLGDNSQATKENVQAFDRDYWTMITTQAETTAEEWTEFYLWPNFGDDLFFEIEPPDVPALQPDLKLQADADEVEVRMAKVTINELRERDGLDPVPWGDVPLISSTLVPLVLDAGAAAEEAPEAEEPPRSAPITVVSYRGLEQLEDDMAAGWERRLRAELRLIIAVLKESDRAGDRVRFSLDDLGRIDWNWWERHRAEVIREIEVAFVAQLGESGFVETPLLPAQQVAANYARTRGANLLQLGGTDSLVSVTRDAVRQILETAIEDGIGPRELANRLRASQTFSQSRAVMIARTETAKATTQASLKSYASQGTEGKEWVTAGDDAVDRGSGPKPCLDNEGQGPIPLHQAFVSGHDGPPAHPRCRCTVVPVRQLPRKVIKAAERDEDGRLLRLIETEATG